MTRRAAAVLVGTVVTLGLSPEMSVAEESSSWSVGFPASDVRCDGAGVRLSLKDRSGETIGRFTPDVSQTTEWAPGSLSPGRYGIEVAGVDCDGGVGVTKTISIEVQPGEVGRLVIIGIRQVGQTLEIYWTDSCSVLDGSKAAVSADRGIEFRNPWSRPMAPCARRLERGAIDVLATGGSRPRVVDRLAWPVAPPLSLERGETITIDLDSTVLDLDAGESFSTAKMWIEPEHSNAVVHGWDERAPAPHLPLACCDSVVVDLTSVASFDRSVVSSDRGDPSSDGRADRTGHYLMEIAHHLTAETEGSGRYPDSAGQIVQLTEVIRTHPELDSALPKVDSWGRAIVYWSDGASLFLASAGCDGEFEVDYGEFLDTLITDYDGTRDRLCVGEEASGDDIVFFENNLCRWPGSDGSGTRDPMASK